MAHAILKMAGWMIGVGLAVGLLGALLTNAYEDVFLHRVTGGYSPIRGGRGSQLIFYFLLGAGAGFALEKIKENVIDLVGTLIDGPLGLLGAGVAFGVSMLITLESTDIPTDTSAFLAVIPALALAVTYWIRVWMYEAM